MTLSHPIVASTLLQMTLSHPIVAPARRCDDSEPSPTPNSHPPDDSESSPRRAPIAPPSGACVRI